jgi:hypothetical protein
MSLSGHKKGGMRAAVMDAVLASAGRSAELGAQNK